MGRLPFRRVRPSCWLFLPQVGKDLSKHRAEPILDVARNEDFRCLSSHFRVDLPSNLRCSAFVIKFHAGMDPAALRTCAMMSPV